MLQDILRETGLAYQREFVVGGIGGKRYVGTFGVATCVAIILYNKERKVAIVAHCDSPTDVLASFDKIYEELRTEYGLSPEDMQAYIIGGGSNASEDLLNRIYQGLYGTQILGVDVRGSLNDDSRSFIFDTETGKIFYITGKINNINLDNERVKKALEGIIIKESLESILSRKPINVNDNPYFNTENLLKRMIFGNQ